MKKHPCLLCCLVTLLAMSAPLQASPAGDILLQLRFYEGERGPKPADAKVVTAYTLRPLFVGNFITEKGLQEEEAELKRVFNLKGLSVLVQTQWGWERDKTEKRFQMVVLNGHEFLLQVAKLAAVDAFQVQVIDQAAREKPALLDNEVVLPAGKVAVFGFEDSLSRPYFLALQRHADADVILVGNLREGGKWDKFPIARLLKKVDPVYPARMVEAGLQGNVTIQIEVDEQGKVWNAKPFSGEEDEFVRAAVDAVRQWRVEPLLVDGKAQPQVFTCTFYFRQGGDVALDFTRPSAPLTRSEENLLRKLRSLSEPLLGPGFKAGEISLDFKNLIPSEKVGLFLTQIAGLAIAFDPAVKARITCDIPNMPWDQALARLLNSHELDIVRKGDGLLIVNRFRAIWPTAGYIGWLGEKGPDGAAASLLDNTGKGRYLTSIFGKRLNPLTRKEEFHPGLDIAAKKGAPVLSAAAGTVLTSEFNDRDGNRVVIDHGNGYASAYHHLDSRLVKAGDTVTQGQQIGTVGETGVSTGPHLHFEIRVDGEPRNPFDFIGQ